MLYQAIVYSKLDYGCSIGPIIQYQSRQLDINNTGLKLALKWHPKVNEALLEERLFKLFMRYHLKTRACINNPAHHALYGFDRITTDIYFLMPNLFCVPHDTQLSTRNPSIQSNETISLKEWTNVGSPNKKPRPNSTSIMTLTDHMMRSTLADPK